MNWQKLREMKAMSRQCVANFMKWSLEDVIALEEGGKELSQEDMRKLNVLFDLRKGSGRKLFKELFSLFWSSPESPTEGSG